MKTIHLKKNGPVDQNGFTIIEVLIAASISTVVLAIVLTTFIWNAQMASLNAKTAWSQNEAMRTSDKLMMYIRNASKIVAIDEVGGSWVTLKFPDGSTGTVTYSNAVPELRDGQMYMRRTNSTQTLVARGLTAIQDSVGFTTPVFLKTRANALRIAYRVSQPAASNGRDANDDDYAVCVRFGACLRNVEP